MHEPAKRSGRWRPLPLEPPPRRGVADQARVDESRKLAPALCLRECARRRAHRQHLSHLPNPGVALVETAIAERPRLKETG